MPEPVTENSASPNPEGFDIQSYFHELHARSGEILQKSLEGGNAVALATSRQFCLEIPVWKQSIDGRREAELLRIASLEYDFALLALAQGHYRHAFKALRLVLELCLQAVALSANELCLREWLDNRRDTNWAAIKDEQTGIFSKAFADGFFPELNPHIAHYRELAKDVYRECSECVHGNIPKHVPLPNSLLYEQTIFDLWHSKAATVARIVHFGFCLRYLCDLEESQVSALEPILNERVGHVAEIRNRLGGPVKA